MHCSMRSTHNSSLRQCSMWLRKTCMKKIAAMYMNIPRKTKTQTTAENELTTNATKSLNAVSVWKMRKRRTTRSIRKARRSRAKLKSKNSTLCSTTDVITSATSNKFQLPSGPLTNWRPDMTTRATSSTAINTAKITWVRDTHNGNGAPAMAYSMPTCCSTPMNTAFDTTTAMEAAFKMFQEVGFEGDQPSQYQNVSGQGLLSTPVRSGLLVVSLWPRRSQCDEALDGFCKHPIAYPNLAAWPPSRPIRSSLKVSMSKGSPADPSCRPTDMLSRSALSLRILTSCRSSPSACSSTLSSAIFLIAEASPCCTRADSCFHMAVAESRSSDRSSSHFTARLGSIAGRSICWARADSCRNTRVLESSSCDRISSSLKAS
mmetsp:Transcript_102874/g.290629  ORF Transcript_102874/g.290629 Transcript_102874/m.290629 type:complete len:375 (+) Transcript_102874:404-1528(+)